MGQGWWGWGKERNGDTKQNKPTRPTKGKMKSSAFVHRTVRCWRRKRSWCKEEAHSFPTRRGGHQGAPRERPRLGPAPGRGLARWVGGGGESRPVGASNLRAGSDRTRGGPSGRVEREPVPCIGSGWAWPSEAPSRAPRGPALPSPSSLGRVLPSRSSASSRVTLRLVVNTQPSRGAHRSSHANMPGAQELPPGTDWHPEFYVFAEESFSKAAETTPLLPAPGTLQVRGLPRPPVGPGAVCKLGPRNCRAFGSGVGPGPGAERRRGARLELPAPSARALDPVETTPSAPRRGCQDGCEPGYCQTWALEPKRIPSRTPHVTLLSTEVLKTPYKRASWVPRRSALPASASPERGPGAAVWRWERQEAPLRSPRDLRNLDNCSLVFDNLSPTPERGVVS